MISDIRRLRSLQEVAHRGTITAAAEAIGYTPSAISQQLAALEAELGVPVLERSGRNVVLTDAGRLLVRHGAEAISALERAESAVAELHGKPVGPIRIGALASATASILPVALRAALAEHPGLEPTVVVHPLDENLRELRLGGIDIAVDQSYDSAPDDGLDDFERTVLLEEPLLLLSPAGDPVHRVVDAAGRDWVASPATSSCGRSTRAIAASAGLVPRFTYETDDHFATVNLVSAGLAVAVVPGLALLHRPPNVHVAVVPGAHRSIAALTRPAAQRRPAITAMVEHLVRAAPQFLFEPG